MEPPGTPNHKKSRKTGTQKNTQKTTLQKVGSWSHFDFKSDLFFRTGTVFKITKIRDIFKMGPQASKMSPWAPKIIQNHESGRPKIKNIKKTSRNESPGLPNNPKLKVCTQLHNYL